MSEFPADGLVDERRRVRREARIRLNAWLDRQLPNFCLNGPRGRLFGDPSRPAKYPSSANGRASQGSARLARDLHGTAPDAVPAALTSDVRR